MSDGDNATPGRPRASDSNGANQWLTRSPRPSRAAAPWERRPAAEPEDDRTSAPTGSHTDGVTVADLIAKVTGSAPTDLPSRHAAPEPEPRLRAAPSARRRQPRQLRPPQPRQRTRRTCPTRTPRSSPSVSYADEIPDLAALRRARARARRAGAGGRAVRRTHRPAEEAQVAAPGHAWRGVPWPRSSRCSHWR